MNELRVRREPFVWIAAAVAAAAAAGAALSYSPGAGIAVAGAVVVAAVLSRSTALGAVQISLSALPWLVILDELTPPLVRTFVTAGAAISMLLLAMPLRYERQAGPIAAALFIVVVLAHGVLAADEEQYIQFAKYLIFPSVALAVMSERGQRLLPQARDVVVASALLAMVAHLGLIAAGLGAGDVKYGTGEELGFGSEVIHEMALLFVIVAAAGLTVTDRIPLQVLLFGLGAVPALMTAVRSALLSLLAILIVFVVRARFSGRSLAVIGAIVVVAVASGGASTAAERLAVTTKAETSLEQAGSSRGAIYAAAITGWADEGPASWLFGAGLRSVEEFELQELGTEYIGHTDLIQVGVQLGIVGLAAWIALWIGLLRAHLEALLMLPLIVYALVNGSIGYVAPLTLALALAAACRAPPGERASGGPGRVQVGAPGA